MSYIKYSLACALLLTGVRGNEEKLFTKGPAFANLPRPTFPVLSSDPGVSGSYMSIDFTQDGAGHFPALTWPSPKNDFKEYVIVCEDPDGPSEEAIIHGLFYGIPPVFTALQDLDFYIDDSEGDPFHLTGDFKYGQNEFGNAYFPPQSSDGHDSHRYFFQIIALNETMDRSNLSDMATLEEIAQEVEGKVAGWGQWVGTFERSATSLCKEEQTEMDYS